MKTLILTDEELEALEDAVNYRLEWMGEGDRDAWQRGDRTALEIKKPERLLLRARRRIWHAVDLVPEATGLRFSRK